MDKFYNKTDYHGDYTSILCYNNKPTGEYQDLMQQKRDEKRGAQKTLKWFFFIIVKFI